LLNTPLIDGGSTHNFVQDRVAKFLNLKIQPTNTLQVMVGNGSEIERHQRCPRVRLAIQGQIFDIDLYVLPISGGDLVLGIQWLKELGPVVTDFAKLTMRFAVNSILVELKADAPRGPSDISAQQLKRIFQTNGVASFYHLRVLPAPPPESIETDEPPPYPLPQITELLQRFAHLFKPPLSLHHALPITISP
jgi:hypothetical protein